MKELSVNKLENLEGGKMFGTTEYNCGWEYSNGCYVKYCDYKTQFFWVVTERLTHIPKETIC